MNDLFFVAQVSNLPYRGFPIRKPWKFPASPDCRAPAEWNSAIQQIGNLRYALAREQYAKD